MIFLIGISRYLQVMYIYLWVSIRTMEKNRSAAELLGASRKQMAEMAWLGDKCNMPYEDSMTDAEFTRWWLKMSRLVLVEGGERE